MMTLSVIGSSITWLITSMIPHILKNHRMRKIKGIITGASIINLLSILVVIINIFIIAFKLY